MLLRDPCKKCIVRACCQDACDDKIGRDWIEITATLVLSSIVLVEIVFIGYFVIKIINN